MPESAAYDAVIIGSGPNGMAAAITLARAGCAVLVVEGRETIGGGSRSAELTLPGFIHDICAAMYPLATASPFFGSLPLHEHGLEWVYSPGAVAHPLDDDTAVLVERNIETTTSRMGPDAAAYRRLFSPLARDYDRVLHDLLGPLRFPRYPFVTARFGRDALLSAVTLAKTRFRGERARAVLAGMAAHAMLPLEKPGSAAFGLMLSMLAHAGDWPMPRGGSQQFANALASYLRSLNGRIVTGKMVQRMDDLPPAKAYLFDTSPRQLAQIVGGGLPSGYKKRLARYRYGPGVCKADFALDGPIPWRSEECLRSATIHLGGTLEEIAASERDAWEGRHSERPYTIVVQQSLFDPTRAPVGKHTVWAYCHTPHDSDVDATPQIEDQIERFAPGFRSRILAHHVYTAAEMSQYNPNYVGGDINGGAQDLRQLFTRPTARLVPYATPAKDCYLCSSSTPPGGGVHGMCGYFAAKAALRRSIRA